MFKALRNFMVIALFFAFHALFGNDHSRLESAEIEGVIMHYFSDFFSGKRSAHRLTVVILDSVEDAERLNALYAKQASNFTFATKEAVNLNVNPYKLSARDEVVNCVWIFRLYHQGGISVVRVVGSVSPLGGEARILTLNYREGKWVVTKDEFQVSS